MEDLKHLLRALVAVPNPDDWAIELVYKMMEAERNK